ncbi:serine/threonine-protein kinase [uncultured Serinicoccus sp.]|uniref:serine/threonine-protein kinase n=1 Tax=uncultured Serinicoccus sp. TaxID=735514 RepID=UPI00260873A5|nr:serine/threonine-protein kinase [uncultured Serinicoccus sp.]
MTTPTVPGYDLLDPLGAGGSGQVWRARRRADGLPVAVKLVRPGAGDGAALTAVLAEAGLLAGLRHQHVLHLYDVLPLGDPGDPTVALVTQLAAGGSLAQVLGRRRLLSPGELVTVLHPVSAALGDLHRAGVVHGDVSPGNLLFRSDGMPLLGDLGAARVAGEQGLRGWGTAAQEGMVAPEVLEGFVATAESDVYQVGAVAWLCLVGERPGPGFDRPALGDLAPALPPALVELVQACMAPQPEDRPAADDLPTALLAIVDPEPVEVAPGADAATGLTERLRQVALADTEDRAGRPDAGERWWRRPLGRGRGPARAQARPRPVGGGGRSADRPRRGGAHRVPDGTGPARAAQVRLVLGLGLVLAAVGVALWAVLQVRSAPAGVAGAEPTPPAPVVRTAGPPSSGPVQSTPSPAPADPDAAAGTVATGHDGSVRDVVQGLLDHRSAAWEGGDLQRLRQVTAPGSVADVRERSLLGEAAERGLRYPSVSFEVTDAVVEERDTGRLVVDATVRRPALEVWRGEELVHAVAGGVEQVRMVLTAHDRGWLVQRWEPLSPSAPRPPSGPPAPGPGA